jgi:hypothetical protein
MKRLTTVTMALVFAWLLLAGRPVSASGQQPPDPAEQGQPARQAQGPLVLEPVKNSFEVAPEVKVTEIDGRAGTLVGASGGWVVANTLYLGGAGYWLVSHPTDIGMTYGGFIIGWTTPESGAVRLGLRGLVGGGAARLPGFELMPLDDQWTRSPHDPDWRHRRPRYDDTFFVFEPQAEVLIRLTDRLHVSAGFGYRVLASRTREIERLRGVSGTVALRIGGGS